MSKNINCNNVLLQIGRKNIDINENNNISRNNNNIDENYIKKNKSISNLPNLEDKLIKNQDKLTKQYSLSKLPKPQINQKNNAKDREHSSQHNNNNNNNNNNDN